MFETALVGGVRPAHSRCMRRFAMGVSLVSLACVAACSSDGADEASGPIHNGQTGSLTPVCGLRAEQLVLRESQRGFVVDTAGCRANGALSGLSLAGDDGRPVEFRSVSLGNGKYLIIPSVELEPGEYAVSLEGSRREVTVEEPTMAPPPPPPARVGELTGLAPRSCGLNLALTLDPALVPFAPLTKLTLSIDGSRSVYRDYGELTADDAVIEIVCEGYCAGPGRHRVEVHAELADEALALEPASVTVDVECDGVEDDAGCSFSPGPEHGYSALVVVVVLGLSARRRASARRESREMKRGSPG